MAAAMPENKKKYAQGRHPNTLKSLKSWKKGQSGNPGGKLKGERELIQICQEITPRAVEVLWEIMNDEEKSPPVVRARAAEWFVERGYGGPPKKIQLDINTDKMKKMTDDELEARIRDLEGRRQKLLEDKIIEADFDETGTEDKLGKS